MMKSVLSTLCLSLLLHQSSSAQILPKEFWNALQTNKMVYAIPRTYSSTPVINNSDVEYDFAIRSKDKQLEIRYAIRPIIPLQHNSNTMSDVMVSTMALNISGGTMVDPQPFPQESVKKEFGADKGYTAMVPVNSDFGKGYKMCMINVIHKDNIADAYIFYLFDHPQTILPVLGNSEVFHALKFK